MLQMMSRHPSIATTALTIAGGGFFLGLILGLRVFVRQ